MLVETSGGQIFFPDPTAASDMRGDSNIEMGGKGDSVPTLFQDSPSGEPPKGSERKNRILGYFSRGWTPLYQNNPPSYSLGKHVHANVIAERAKA